MATHAQIEAAQAVTRKTVAAALEDNGLGLVILHHCLDDWLENCLVRRVVNAIPQREIDGVVLAVADSDVAELAGTGEVLAVLVEGDGHDTVGRVEGLLDTIAMMDINVNVEDALLVAQEFENGENDVCAVRWNISEPSVDSKHSETGVRIPLT